MHKMAMEKAKGLDNFNAEDWEKLKYTMEIVKNAICADKDYRIVCAMDEAEEEEKFIGRMGYRGRARNGRFVHRSGRGRSAGYTPYLHMMEDGMDDYDMYDEMPYPMTGYRMGYTGGNMGNSSSSGSYSGNYGSGNSRSGYESMRQPSRYGESYDRYSDRRRHYHESGDEDSKKKMEDSIGEVFDDMENVVQDVWKEMTPEQKQKYKARMTQMVQKMQ